METSKEQEDEDVSALMDLNDDNDDRFDVGDDEFCEYGPEDFDDDDDVSYRRYYRNEDSEEEERVDVHKIHQGNVELWNRTVNITKRPKKENINEVLNSIDFSIRKMQKDARYSGGNGSLAKVVVLFKQPDYRCESKGKEFTHESTYTVIKKIKECLPENVGLYYFYYYFSCYSENMKYKKTNMKEIVEGNYHTFYFLKKLEVIRPEYLIICGKQLGRIVLRDCKFITKEQYEDPQFRPQLFISQSKPFKHARTAFVTSNQYDICQSLKENASRPNSSNHGKSKLNGAYTPDFYYIKIEFERITAKIKEDLSMVIKSPFERNPEQVNTGGKQEKKMNSLKKNKKVSKSKPRVCLTEKQIKENRKLTFPYFVPPKNVDDKIKKITQECSDTSKI